jgi:broad-specificity NMP kinase
MVPASLDARGTQILAKSLFKELRGSGYSDNQIINLSSELLDLVTKDLRDRNAQPTDEAAKGSAAVA